MMEAMSAICNLKQHREDSMALKIRYLIWIKQLDNIFKAI